MPSTTRYGTRDPALQGGNFHGDRWMESGGPRPTPPTPTPAQRAAGAAADGRIHDAAFWGGVDSAGNLYQASSGQARTAAQEARARQAYSAQVRGYRDRYEAATGQPAPMVPEPWQPAAPTPRAAGGGATGTGPGTAPTPPAGPATPVAPSPTGAPPHTAASNPRATHPQHDDEGLTGRQILQRREAERAAGGSSRHRDQDLEVVVTEYHGGRRWSSQALRDVWANRRARRQGDRLARDLGLDP